MRVMKNGDQKVNVIEHIIIRNLWEYYVLGFESEFGDVSMEEIKPHVISRCKGRKLEEVMPAPGWSWV
jgi:hypothetical protein